MTVSRGWDPRALSYKSLLRPEIMIYNFQWRLEVWSKSWIAEFVWKFTVMLVGRWYRCSWEAKKVEADSEEDHASFTCFLLLCSVCSACNFVTMNGLLQWLGRALNAVQIKISELNQTNHAHIGKKRHGCHLWCQTSIGMKDCRIL